MAKSDVLVRMKADVSSYNANIASASRTLSQFKQANLTASGVINQLTKSLTTAAAGYLGIASAGSAIAGLVKESVELAKAGEGIRIAFQKLNRPDLLNGLREATHGTVTDIELMKSAVKFNDFKLPLDQLGTMLAFAQQKAKDTGQSVDYMVDSIVTGLGRKSLMILDNLGLSAAEIKEKMAETGDMTKAVGEIIREQMAKAGDYMETAADRAAQANVSLQNKMEELGRQVLPLQESYNNLWTSMKIGILDIIGGPLTSLLNKLTEAGRLAQQYGVLGGNAKVGRLTANLAGASEANRQNIYQQQQQQFWRYINLREQQIKDIRAWQRGERSEALQGRINAITQKYGSLDATKIQAEVDAAKKMLADYQQAAKTILNPVKADINTSDAEQNVASLTKKLKELKAERAAAIKAGDSDKVKNLTQQINATQRDIKALDPNALKTGSSKNPLDKIAFDINKANLAGEKIKDTMPSVKSLFDQSQMDASADAWKKYKDTVAGSIDDIGDSMKNMTKWTDNFDPYKEKMDTLTKAARTTADVVGSIGDAFNAIEDPAAKVMGTVMDAIANVALGYAQATVAAAQTGNPWVWAAFAVSGLATMITMISNIHSATGYAEGGIVGGTSYSGDNIPIMANAGELVLTKAQQNTLAQNLQGGGMGSMNLKTKVKGTELLVWLDNSLAQSGRGELVTWGQ